MEVRARFQPCHSGFHDGLFACLLHLNEKVAHCDLHLALPALSSGYKPCIPFLAAKDAVQGPKHCTIAYRPPRQVAFRPTETFAISVRQGVDCQNKLRAG